jgi:hypothetical protein
MSDYSYESSYSGSDEPPKYDESVPKYGESAPKYEEHINCDDFDKSKLLIGPFDRKIFRKFNCVGSSKKEYSALDMRKYQCLNDKNTRCKYDPFKSSFYFPKYNNFNGFKFSFTVPKKDVVIRDVSIEIGMTLGINQKEMMKCCVTLDKDTKKIFDDIDNMIFAMLPVEKYRETYDKKVITRVELPSKPRKFWQSKKLPEFEETSKIIKVTRKFKYELNRKENTIKFNVPDIIEDETFGQNAQIFITFKVVKMIIIDKIIKVFPTYQIDKIIIK